MAPRKVSEDFQKSYDRAKYLKHASQNDQLDLYAFAVIAKQEKDLKTAKKPGMMDIAGKAKRKQWEKYLNQDDPLTADEAEKEYIKRINKLVEEHGLKDECPEKLK